FEVSTTNYARPNYVPRTSWGASMGLSNYGNHSSINVTHLWVHHSAGHTNSSDYAAVVRSYYLLHTVDNGWSDMGYQWLVDPNGVLYQGRSHTYNVVTDSYDSDVVGAHAPGANSVAMAICMIGDYTN